MAAQIGFSLINNFSFLPRPGSHWPAVFKVFIISCVLMIPPLFWMSTNPSPDYALSANMPPGISQQAAAAPPPRQFAGGAAGLDLVSLPILGLINTRLPGTEPNFRFGHPGRDAPEYSGSPPNSDPANHPPSGTAFHPAASTGSGYSENIPGSWSFAASFSGFQSYAGFSSSPSTDSPGGNISSSPHDQDSWIPSDNPGPGPEDTPPPDETNAPVPEPATLILLGTGILGLTFRSMTR